MDTEQIKQIIRDYLKENLTVETDVAVSGVDYQNDYYNVSVTVRLMIGDEEITSDEHSDTFHIPS